jgi:hypothetical protein
MRKWAAWLDQFKPTKRRQFNLEIVRERDDCGTVACAVGWCPTIFPEHWKLIRDGSEIIAVTLKKSISKSVDGDLWWDDFDTAAMEFFGLTGEQVSRIMYASAYEPNPNPSPQLVAARIREIINEG